MCKSLSIDSNRINSQVALAMDLYFASADDLETVCCFFNFHDTRESPMKKQYPLMDFMLSGQDAQSESAKPLSSVEEEDEKRSP